MNRRRVDLAGLERGSLALQAALDAVDPTRRRSRPDQPFPPPNPSRYLDWLQSFATRQVDSKSDRAATALQVAVFCAGQVGWSQQWVAQWAAGARRRPAGTAEQTQRVDLTDDLAAAQVIVRQILSDLRAGEPTWFPMPVADGMIWRATARSGAARSMRRRPGIRLVTRGGGLRQFLSALADFFVTIGPRLRLCQSDGCGRFFVPDHGRQRCCEKTCGNRERQRRWRRAHRASLPEKRHEWYKARMQARFGAKVQVTRRARRAATN